MFGKFGGQEGSMGVQDRRLGFEGLRKGTDPEEERGGGQKGLQKR